MELRGVVKLKQSIDLMIRPFLIPVLLTSLVQPVGGAESVKQLQTIRALLTERLVIMEQVAAFKWNEGLPIDDKDREATILEKTIAKAVAEGLETTLASHVVTAQIEAAKTVQHALFHRWRAAASGRHPKVPSLTAELRPKISRLSSELIVALVAARDDLDGCLARQILSPLPRVLTRFPRAWALAADGALDVLQRCQ